MGTSVKEVVRRRGQAIRPGDVYAVNDPYHGGTHLPDITVVTPVFGSGATAGSILFFVASRGHHAEIGGIAPGSMPANSRDVHEEGVLFDNWLLASDGRFRELETRRQLTEARYPSRAPDTNLGDLRAQVAANAKGVEELGKMIDHFGLEVVLAYMGHVQDNAEESVRRVIDALDDGAYEYETDSGAVIAVRVTVDRRRRSATIDFTGTSPQLATNFNAPSSVVTAAVLYVFRTLVATEIPLNDGCMRPLHLVIPEGSMLAPVYPAAVVAGNVETSQAITGALYAALGIQAEGSGTMNNVTWGNARHQYYETVASGSGARGRVPRRLGGADPHDQRPAHRSRGARVAVPGARRGVRRAAGERRRRPVAGRRRGGAADPVPRADDGEHAVQSPSGCALRHGGWVTRRPRPAPPGADGRLSGRDGRRRLGGGRSGRCPRRSHARRRRIRASLTRTPDLSFGTGPVRGDLKRQNG